ncbi:LacI family DNA-binding transcriptional regulator [Microbacterium sp. Marseille-Q6965]|uniref:LacI family DNA-binding transcriptional regulator n=1 Tax=Microbacterium sp. Marseille-Q6965 TaxID=2965072 RepID=UPI0021B83418|nr:LacI family DNA-binding transcriptional regulator [Microbacterium sp. Marseille-Q6965]
MAKKRVTLRDVAHAAGVSRTTASNVVAGVGRVSDETRERVREVMAELGYVYHQAAGSLRRRSSRSVGVVVTNIHRPHYGELLIGLESTLTEAGYTLLMVSTMDRVDRQRRAIATLREHDVAGVAIIPATGSDTGLIDELREWGVPSAFVSRHVPAGTHPYIGIDNAAGAYLAVRHLLEHGCRRIAYVGSFPGVSSRQERVAGARRAIDESGTDATFEQFEGEPTAEGGQSVARRMIREGALPDGVICHGDLVALGFGRELHDAGRGGDVRVIGFDGLAQTAFWTPALTTVDTHAADIGAEVARALLAAIDADGEVASRMLEPRLIVRESCGPHEIS